LINDAVCPVAGALEGIEQAAFWLDW